RSAGNGSRKRRSRVPALTSRLTGSQVLIGWRTGNRFSRRQNLVRDPTVVGFAEQVVPQCECRQPWAPERRGQDFPGWNWGAHCNAQLVAGTPERGIARSNAGFLA